MVKSSWTIEIKFLGEWCIWRKGPASKKEALESLSFWRDRTSWPLRLIDPTGRKCKL